MSVRLGARKSAWAIVATLLFVATLAVLVLRQVFSTLPTAEVTKHRPFGDALARHTVLVVVDGLRYDIAHDPRLMPRLRDRLDRYGDAVLLASPVSMTSAAVLLASTGVRGDLEQIIANESHRPTPFDSVEAAVAEDHAALALVGDPVWSALVPGVWTIERTKASHSLEVDEDDAFFASAAEVLLAPDPPRLTIVHLNTPDKKGHAHGVTSEAYASYLRTFDTKLEAFLARLPPTLSILVTSDHGATDSGSHGSDTPVQRRSPFLAFGPGLAEHPRARDLDQLDLAATLAALTGVRPPAQGRGHVATEILAVSEARAAELACAQLANVHRFAADALGIVSEEEARAVARCTTLRPPEAIKTARAAARSLDARIGSRRADSPLGFVPALLAALTLGGAFLLLGGARTFDVTPSALVAAVAALAAGLTVTWGFELLPDLWPNRARIAGYLLGNAPLFALLVRPRACLARLGHRGATVALGLPGILLLTEPKTTQAEAFATLAVIALVALFGRHRSAPFAFGEALRRHTPALVALAALAAPGVLDDDFVPRLVADRPWACHGTAAGMLAVYIAWRRDHRALSRREAVVVACAGLVGLVLRETSPVVPAVTLWAAGGALLPALTLRAALDPTPDRARAHAILAAVFVFVYALVSRDLEWPFLVAGVVLAAHLGEELGRDEGTEVRLVARAMLLTATFCIVYVGRVGVQQGFHFLHMDSGAGAFRDPAVSTWRIGFGIATKHVLAIAAMLASVSLSIPAALRARLLRGLVLATLARIVVTTLMLHVCRNSFWTPVWVVGELPNALITLFCAVLFLAFEEGPERPISPAAS